MTSYVHLIVRPKYLISSYQSFVIMALLSSNFWAKLPKSHSKSFTSREHKKSSTGTTTRRSFDGWRYTDGWNMLITKPKPSMTFWTSFAQICGASRLPYTGLLKTPYKLRIAVLGVLAGKLNVNAAATVTVEKSALNVHDHDPSLSLGCMDESHLLQSQAIQAAVVIPQYSFTRLNFVLSQPSNLQIRVHVTFGWVPSPRQATNVRKTFPVPPTMRSNAADGSSKRDAITRPHYSLACVPPPQRASSLFCSGLAFMFSRKLIFSPNSISVVRFPFPTFVTSLTIIPNLVLRQAVGRSLHKPRGDGVLPRQP